mmetsp:Transcript_6634/g.28289  ORF Transcript_6634/g.28289 Transcript_6634/m.28289 type:complete len:260 (-) Transcript_6634:4024-4803(-)
MFPKLLLVRVFRRGPKLELTGSIRATSSNHLLLPQILYQHWRPSLLEQVRRDCHTCIRSMCRMTTTNQRGVFGGQWEEGPRHQQFLRRHIWLQRRERSPCDILLRRHHQYCRPEIVHRRRYRRRCSCQAKLAARGISEAHSRCRSRLRSIFSRSTNSSNTNTSNHRTRFISLNRELSNKRSNRTSYSSRNRGLCSSNSSSRFASVNRHLCSYSRGYRVQCRLSAAYPLRHHLRRRRLQEPHNRTGQRSTWIRPTWVLRT